jgi:hypothetical protein
MAKGQKMRDVDRLTACLAELDRSGWKVGEYLATRSDLPESMRLSLQAAGMVRGLPRPVPSDAFRARSRSHLITFIQNQAFQNPTRNRQARIQQAVGRFLRPVLVPVAAVALVLSGSAGVWSASASSLPGTPLYGAKLAIERFQLLTAFTPDQQLSVHLSVASARLQEANAETWVGNRASGERLLGEYDGEIAKAQSILLSQASQPGADNILAQSDWELVLLQEQRERLVNASSAPAVAAEAPAPATSSDDLAAIQPTVSPVDPSKLQPSNSNLANQSASAGDESSNEAAQGPGLVGISGGVGVAGVAVARTDQTTTSAVPDAQKASDRLDRLVKVLLAQASAGDAAGAAATAQEFALGVKDGEANGTLSVNSLMFDRSRLQEALAVAPASTRESLRVALSAIYDAVPGSRPIPKAVVTPHPAAPAAPVLPSSSNAPAAIQPTEAPAAAPTVVPTPTVAAPNPSVSAPGATGQQHSSGGGQRPVSAPSPVPSPAPPPASSSVPPPTLAPKPSPAPGVSVPLLPVPSIQRPIIVRDPNLMPSPSLTGRKPLLIKKT